MPPYFNFSLQFLRKDLYPGFMADFDAHLERCGLGFKAGYAHGEGDTQAEIAAANQAKLEADLEWTCEDYHPCGHKQILYVWKNYGHVRGFWYNRYPSEDTFSLELIIPEYEVLIQEDSGIFHPERAEELLALAKLFWQFPLVRAIQTGLESSDASTALEELRAGAPPGAMPFAILETDCTPAGVRPIYLVSGGPPVDRAEMEELRTGRPGRVFVLRELISNIP